jgi:RNA polymerase sigma factor (sigma-70 family)
MTADSFQVFETERPRLLGLAYRLLGARADADDVVQDAWLRWHSADRGQIANPAGWLTTVTTRLALDRLRQLARRRQAYVGPWLPEPISTEHTPEEHTELAESLTLGFLVVLERLAPVERAVLLLADVFGEPYSVISAAVGKSDSACRQTASRARRKVRAAAPVPATARPWPELDPQPQPQSQPQPEREPEPEPGLEPRPEPEPEPETEPEPPRRRPPGPKPELDPQRQQPPQPQPEPPEPPRRRPPNFSPACWVPWRPATKPASSSCLTPTWCS